MMPVPKILRLIFNTTPCLRSLPEDTRVRGYSQRAQVPYSASPEKIGRPLTCPGYTRLNQCAGGCRRPFLALVIKKIDGRLVGHGKHLAVANMDAMNGPALMHFEHIITACEAS